MQTVPAPALRSSTAPAMRSTPGSGASFGLLSEEHSGTFWPECSTYHRNSPGQT